MGGWLGSEHDVMMQGPVEIVREQALLDRAAEALPREVRRR